MFEAVIGDKSKRFF